MDKQKKGKKKDLRSHKTSNFMTTSYLWLWVLLALIVGGFVGSYFFGSEKVVEKPVIVKETEIKVVEIPVPSETKTEVDSEPINRAKKVLLKEIDENEDLWECDGDDYEPSDISVVRVRNYNVEKQYSDDVGEYEVEFDARVKYHHDDETCYEDFDVVVEYDNDREEPLVEVD